MSAYGFLSFFFLLGVLGLLKLLTLLRLIVVRGAGARLRGMGTEAGPNGVPRTVPSCGFALIAFASVLRFALTGPVALYLVFLFCFLFFLAAACECALWFFSAGAFRIPFLRIAWTLFPAHHATHR
jgi:hypothetical protein